MSFKRLQVGICSLGEGGFFLFYTIDFAKKFAKNPLFLTENKRFYSEKSA